MKQQRILAGFAGLGLILALALWGLGQGSREVAGVEPTTNAATDHNPPVDPISIAVPAVHRTRAGSLEGAGELSAGDDHEAPAQASEADDTEIWRLVAELEVLAGDRETFHHRALAVIQRLTRACADHRAGREASDGRQRIVLTLLDRVVLEPERVDLVRGAVLLATSVPLPADVFERTFAALFDARETSSELLRSAGVAAALRGEDPRCGTPLDLAFLGGLQTALDGTLPHIYPLRLNRMLGAPQSEVLRSWFGATESTRARFVLGAEAGSPEKQAQLQDYMITYELFFALRGHRALVDPELEQLVLERAGAISAIAMLGDPNAAESVEQPNMIDFRVAVFLVHSLSICSDTMFDSAIALSESENPLALALADSMKGLVSGGFSVALMSDLERMRYSDKASDRTELFLSLWDAAESLAAMENPVDQERSAAYVSGFVLDPAVDGKVRAAGLSGIARAGQWDAFSKAARRVLLAESGKEVQNSAMNFLFAWPVKDRSKLSAVLEILEDVAQNSPSQKVRESCAQYLDNPPD